MVGEADATHRHCQIIECSCFFATRKARWDKHEQLECTSARVRGCKAERACFRSDAASKRIVLTPTKIVKATSTSEPPFYC